MDNRKRTRRAAAGLLAIILSSSTLAATIAPAMADETGTPTTVQTDTGKGGDVDANVTTNPLKDGLTDKGYQWVTDNGKNYTGTIASLLKVNGFDFAKTQYTKQDGVTADTLKTIADKKDLVSSALGVANAPFKVDAATGWYKDDGITRADGQSNVYHLVLADTNDPAGKKGVTYTFTTLDKAPAAFPTPGAGNGNTGGNNGNNGNNGDTKPDAQTTVTIDLSKATKFYGLHATANTDDTTPVNGTDLTKAIKPGKWKATYKTGTETSTDAVLIDVHAKSRPTTDGKALTPASGDSATLKLKDAASKSDASKDYEAEVTLDMPEGAIAQVTSGKGAGTLTLTLVEAYDTNTDNNNGEAKPDTAVKPVTIDLSQRKTPTGVYATKDGTKPTKNKDGDITQWDTITPGDWTLTYKAPKADNAATSIGPLGHYTGSTLKDGVLTYSTAATDPTPLTVADPDSGDKTGATSVDVTLKDGDVIVLPASTGYTFGTLTLTPKATGDNGTDNNNGNNGNNAGKDDDTAKPDANATTYDLKIGTVSSYGFYGDANGAKVDGLVDDITQTIKPGVYEVTYTDDPQGGSKADTNVAIGSVYSSSTLSPSGNKTVGTGDHTDIKVRDKADPTKANQNVPVSQTITVNQGGIGWFIGGKSKGDGTVHLRLVKALDTNAGKDAGKAVTATDADKARKGGLANTGVGVTGGILATIAIALSAATSVILRRRHTTTD